MKQWMFDSFQDNAELVSMSEGEVLFSEGDPLGGIYIIVSGLVKVGIIDFEVIYTIFL